MNSLYNTQQELRNMQLNILAVLKNIYEAMLTLRRIDPYCIEHDRKFILDLLTNTTLFMEYSKDRTTAMHDATQEYIKYLLLK